MKLPSVYANKIEKDIRNNVDYYHGDNNKKEQKDLLELKRMFDKRGYVNRLSVMFMMKDGNTRNEKLVLCKDNYFVNLNNDKIYFDEIEDYEIKK